MSLLEPWKMAISDTLLFREFPGGSALAVATTATTVAPALDLDSTEIKVVVEAEILEILSPPPCQAPSTVRHSTNVIINT